MCAYDDAAWDGEAPQHWTFWGRHYEEYERDLSKTERPPYVRRALMGFASAHISTEHAKCKSRTNLLDSQNASCSTHWNSSDAANRQQARGDVSTMQLPPPPPSQQLQTS